MSDAGPALTNARRALLVVLGFFIAGYSTMCGIGGGLFAVPLLHYAFGMSLQLAVANSLVLVAASTTSATIVELAHPGSSLNFGVAAVLIAASFFGARVGYRVAKRLDARMLKLVFCLLLLGVATHVLFGTQSTAAETSALATSYAPTSIEWLEVLVIGLAAGFVAPMLGIGGGLVAVPGLLFGLPSLGYLGVRACSVAMSMCTGWQSVWLYRRDGSLRTSTSLWLAGGALVGAVVGIELVHVPSITRIARSMVAFALYFAAVRFAWDLFTVRRAERSSAPR